MSDATQKPPAPRTAHEREFDEWVRSSMHEDAEAIRRAEKACKAADADVAGV